ncbi:conserved hypothetical protein [Nitrosococcus oceani ATCC 19707]|uniref:Carboxypeptidase regulatory-like domain-containing protein n=2 Tax=Nitrosococcus oceani TaxID=1229 RepID=Q3JCT8_NITOC|nr:hypothetical protein [Nitrosococcus oceani]ABA57358.1 conserved hypothetical protein [Nitrosococcus oceani ATCC 19707]EDZ67776.1 hypothetical protein NOC27_1103 [Nitrosococcus oceani AFC27]KFI20335.1 hypothetical protein IB75_04265 [Nitrosococcus oceani C-27]
MKHFAYRSMVQLRLLGLIFTAMVASTACSEAEKSASKPAVPVTISGSMNGEDGPIKEAKLTATDSHGEVITTAEVSGRARYQLELPAGAAYPVIISAIYPRSTKIEKSGQGEVKAVVMEASSSTVELSPRSTAIVNMALARGGLTLENFKAASAAALNLGAGSGGGSGGGHGGH